MSRRVFLWDVLSAIALALSLIAVMHYLAPGGERRSPPNDAVLFR